MDKLTILTQVIDITTRFDKTDYTASLIDSVCASIANRVRAGSSLVEQSIVVPRDALIHNIALDDAFLGTSYLRPSGFNKTLKPIHPSKVFHGGLELVNVYYQSGNKLIVRLGSGYTTDALLFGWFSTPPKLINDTDTNWVTRNYAELLIHLLCSKVFQIVGDFDSARTSAQIAAGLYEEVRINESNAGVVSPIGVG